MKIRKQNWILIILFLATLFFMIYYGTQKEGYHVDEIYSYGLANSEYLPFMHFGNQEYSVKDWMEEYGTGESLGDLFRNLRKDFQILKQYDFQWKESPIYRDYLTAQANSADTRTTTWMSGQAYQDYIAVEASNTFNYASVYYNQRGDVHPPLYYMCLHTICSVFQGVFSPWFGLGLNIAVLLLTLFLLERMVKSYLGGEAVALAVVSVYGLSSGLMTTTLYIRMYALMTFMLVACCAVHLKIAAEDYSIKRKNGILLMLVTIGGYMTHYYFVLYALGMAIVFSIVLLYGKKWVELLKYLMLLGCSAAVGLLIWPFALKHVFQGYRGVAALGTIMTGEFYLIKIRLMFQQITQNILGGQDWIFWLMSAAMIGYCLWKRGKGIPWIKAAIVLVPCIFYLVVVSQIVPFYVERYVMCLFPFGCLYLTAGSALLIREIKDRRKYLVLLAGISLVWFLLNNCLTHGVGYLYTGGQETVKISPNTDCVYVLPDGDWNESAVDSTILAQCRNVAVAYQSSLEFLKGSYAYVPGDVIMIAIQKNMDIDAVLEEVREVLGVEGLPVVYQTEGSTAVRIFLSDDERYFS